MTDSSTAKAGSPQEETEMRRNDVYRIVILALNQKMAATKHKPTRARLDAAKWWLADDPAFRWESTTDAENVKRLNQIEGIIDQVETRCMAADGPVTPTLQEMTQDELSRIWRLASFREKPRNDD